MRISDGKATEQHGVENENFFSLSMKGRLDRYELVLL